MIADPRIRCLVDLVLTSLELYLLDEAEIRSRLQSIVEQIQQLREDLSSNRQVILPIVEFSIGFHDGEDRCTFPLLDGQLPALSQQLETLLRNLEESAGRRQAVRWNIHLRYFDVAMRFFLLGRKIRMVAGAQSLPQVRNAMDRLMREILSREFTSVNPLMVSHDYLGLARSLLDRDQRAVAQLSLQQAERVLGQFDGDADFAEAVGEIRSNVDHLLRRLQTTYT